MATEKRQRRVAVEKAVDLGKMGAIVRKNWLVLKGDRIRLVPLILFPIIMIVLFGYAAGNMPRHISAAIVDYDQTPFSRGIVSQIGAMDIFSVKHLIGTQDEGKRLMDQGKINVLFIIPQGLEEKVQSGQQAQLELMVDESDSSVAQISKSSAQAFAQRLSTQVASERMDAMSAKASAASGELSAASQALSPSVGTSAIRELDASSAAYARDSAYVFSASSRQIAESVVALENSLGYLIDQNEIADSYSPASMGQASLTALATGDSQQSVLQQVGLYELIGARQARIHSNSLAIQGNAQKLSSEAQSRAQSAAIALKLIGSASGKVSEISSDAQSAQNGVELSILAPYGYGRRGIDFLLPSILALIIFQGATMGLGRAIAGERKDGSLTRVFLTPTSNVTIILGTQIFYLLLETIRSSFIIFVAIALFGVSISGSMLDIIAIIALFALGATGVGMVLSVITHNQEQYMAVGMLISLPIMFLSGVFFPIQTMPPALQGFAQVLPVTYAADALRGVMVKGFTLSQVFPDIAALAIFGAGTLTLTLLLFKRELV